MLEVKVTSFSLRDIPSKGEAGALLGYFDVAVAGLVEMRGCCLVRNDRNSGSQYWLTAPSVKDKNGARCIVVTDKSLRNDIIAAALVAYRALGGQGAPA